VRGREEKRCDGEVEDQERCVSIKGFAPADLLRAAEREHEIDRLDNGGRVLARDRRSLADCLPDLPPGTSRKRAPSAHELAVTAVDLPSQTPDGLADCNEGEGDPGADADEPVSIEQERPPTRRRE
jgi:hypothetical protein